MNKNFKIMENITVQIMNKVIQMTLMKKNLTDDIKG